MIGGGAAGLMAAGQAAGAGAEVVLIEKMKRSGRKLAITGKGRCNITNIAQRDEFIYHFGAGGPFLRPAFDRCFSDELLRLLGTLGVATVTERGGRVFPTSGKATDVVRALVRWIIQSGVTSRCGTYADQLVLREGRVVGVRCGDAIVGADAVVLATGGKSYPATGSTGDGYRLAQAAGHAIVPPRPALVPIETAGRTARQLEGLALRNVGIGLAVDGHLQRKAFGELAFTDFGVTGPVVLALSGDAVDALHGGREVDLIIDLKPALDEAKLDRRLQRDLSHRADEPLRSLLRGLLPKPLVRVCLAQLDMRADRKGRDVSAHGRRRLGRWLKRFVLRVAGHRSFDEAIITAGGIDTREVDPDGMASRVCVGLFLAGEVLDIQADTGGYNLQAAFSTGWVAGRSAAAGERAA